MFNILFSVIVYRKMDEKLPHVLTAQDEDLQKYIKNYFHEDDRFVVVSIKFFNTGNFDMFEKELLSNKDENKKLAIITIVNGC